MVSMSSSRRIRAQCRLPRANQQPHNQHAPREPHAAAWEPAGTARPAPAPAILNGGPALLISHDLVRFWCLWAPEPPEILAIWGYGGPRPPLAPDELITA